MAFLIATWLLKHSITVLFITVSVCVYCLYVCMSVSKYTCVCLFICLQTDRHLFLYTPVCIYACLCVSLAISGTDFHWYRVVRKLYLALTSSPPPLPHTFPGDCGLPVRVTRMSHQTSHCRQVSVAVLSAKVVTSLSHSLTPRHGSC